MSEAWTPQQVVSRLEEAASALRPPPGGGSKTGDHNWPKAVRDILEICSGKAVAVETPSPDSNTSPVEEAVTWLKWLTPDQIRLVWLRAAKIPWKVIVARLPCDRTTAWRKWTVAIHIIASRLEASQEKVLQHQDARHLQQNMA